MKKLLLLILPMFMICACNNSRKAVEYNDEIVNEQNNVVMAIIAIAGDSTRDLSRSEGLRLKALESARKSIEKIKAMPGFEENTQLRDASLKLLSYYESALSIEYRELIALNQKENDITPDDATRIMAIKSDIEKKEAIHIALFKKTQKEFSEKYNFRIEWEERKREH